MPIVRCVKNGKKGYKYGTGGKCYTYTSGNAQSRKRALKKALKQAAAMRARGYKK